MSEIVETGIERVVPGGAGLARVGGVVTLVAGALPGDRVRVEVEERRRGLLTGRVVELLAPGPHRRSEADVCPRARDGSCGGCDWPAAAPSSERELKTSLVLDALRRTGRLPSDAIPEPRWHDSPRNYRLRNRFHLDAHGRLGFFAPRSHDVADLSPCELISLPLRERLPRVREALAAVGAAPGELVTLEGRDGTPVLGELRLSATPADPEALAKALRGALDGVRILSPEGRVLAAQGPSALVLEADGARYRVSVSSFFQGNRFLLDAFLGEAREAVRLAAGERPIRRALDLYAGVGYLTRPLVETGAEVAAVEADRSAAADLAHNVGSWSAEGLPAARGVAATAERFLAGWKGPVDLVVADPPRAGMSAGVRRELLRLASAHLVLVSCDPPTFARDVAELAPSYGIDRLTLMNLFPGTHHVELVALMRRRSASEPVGATGRRPVRA